jgi:arsenite methyltransferase
VAGALAERDFVTKLERAGFVEVEILDRRPLTTDDCTLYPLFTPDLLDLMRRLIPAGRPVATSVVVRARRGSEATT